MIRPTSTNPHSFAPWNVPLAQNAVLVIQCPSTFQRLMDLVMRTHETCRMYLDDLIVFSQDIQEHLYQLRLLFERLRRSNLKLKRSKCQPLQKEAKFLGFTYNSHGITVIPVKVEIVRKLPCTTDTTSESCVHWFLSVLQVRFEISRNPQTCTLLGKKMHVLIRHQLVKKHSIS